MYHADWLQILIRIPNLISDVLLVLDCYIEDLSDINTDEKKISFLSDDDYLWARYAIIYAGYTQKSARPGKLSDHLTSVLEGLAHSDTFYAREGLITSSFVIRKLTTSLRFESEMEPTILGNDGRNSVVLVSI